MGGETERNTLVSEQVLITKFTLWYDIIIEHGIIALPYIYSR